MDFERRLESEVDLEVSGDLSLGLGLAVRGRPTPARRAVHRTAEGATERFRPRYTTTEELFDPSLRHECDSALVQPNGRQSRRGNAARR